MSYLITSLGGKDPREIMVDDATIAGTVEEIAAVIGVVEVGTIIYTAGFGVIKQKGLDGTWVHGSDTIVSGAAYTIDHYGG